MNTCDCDVSVLNADWDEARAIGYGWLHYHPWTKTSGYLFCNRHHVYVHVELDIPSKQEVQP